MSELIEGYFKHYLTQVGPYEPSELEGQPLDSLIDKWEGVFLNNLAPRVQQAAEDAGFESGISYDGEFTLIDAVVGVPEAFNEYLGSVLSYSATNFPNETKGAFLGIIHALISQFPDPVKEMVAPVLDAYFGAELDTLFQINPDASIEDKLAEIEQSLSDIKAQQDAFDHAFEQMGIRYKLLKLDIRDIKATLIATNEKTNGLLFQIAGRLDLQSAQFHQIRSKLDELGIGQNLQLRLTTVQMTAQVLMMAAELDNDSHVQSSCADYLTLMRTGTFEEIGTAFTYFLQAYQNGKINERITTIQKQQVIASTGTCLQLLAIAKGLAAFIPDAKVRYGINIAISASQSIVGLCRDVLLKKLATSNVILAAVDISIGLIASIIQIASPTISPEEERYRNIIKAIEFVYENLSAQIDSLRVEVSSNDAEILGALRQLTVSIAGLAMALDYLQQKLELTSAQINDRFRDAGLGAFDNFAQDSHILMNEYMDDSDDAHLPALQEYYRNYQGEATAIRRDSQ